jgi:hypothetical protein
MPNPQAKTRDLQGTIRWISGLAIAISAITYVIAYYWLVSPHGWAGNPVVAHFELHGREMRTDFVTQRRLQTYFAPMISLDRWLRPEVWKATPNSWDPVGWDQEGKLN